MRYLAVLALLAVLPACGGVPADVAKKNDLSLAEAKINENITKQIADLRREFGELEVKQKGLEVLKMKVETQVEQADALLKNLKTLADSLEKKVDNANTNVIKALEIQEQSLKQQLESIRALIDDLKKPK